MRAYHNRQIAAVFIVIGLLITLVAYQNCNLSKSGDNQAQVYHKGGGSAIGNADGYNGKHRWRILPEYTCRQPDGTENRSHAGYIWENLETGDFSFQADECSQPEHNIPREDVNESEFFSGILIWNDIVFSEEFNSDPQFYMLAYCEALEDPEMELVFRGLLDENLEEQNNFKITWITHEGMQKDYILFNVWSQGVQLFVGRKYILLVNRNVPEESVLYHKKISRFGDTLATMHEYSIDWSLPSTSLHCLMHDYFFQIDWTKYNLDSVMLDEAPEFQPERRIDDDDIELIREDFPKRNF